MRPVPKATLLAMAAQQAAEDAQRAVDASARLADRAEMPASFPVTESAEPHVGARLARMPSPPLGPPTQH
eukprot:15463166-Alexandrium_andersonii.AAC.1